MTERAEILAAAARSICHSMRGRGQAYCFCHGELQNCHAATLYADMATAALIGIERAGWTVIRSGFDGFTEGDVIDMSAFASEVMEAGHEHP